MPLNHIKRSDSIAQLKQPNAKQEEKKTTDDRAQLECAESDRRAMSSPSGCARNHPLPKNITKTKREKQILEKAMNNKTRCWLQKAPRSRRARGTTGHHPGNRGQAETKQRKLWTESKRAVMRGGGRGIKGGSGRRRGNHRGPLSLLLFFYPPPGSHPFVFPGEGG